MRTHAEMPINGIIKTETGYAVKNFRQPEKEPIEIGPLSFSSYKAAVNQLSSWLCPDSYKPYLLAVEKIKPDGDTWDNMIFIGHAKGYFDHEEQTFKNARELNMDAASEAEVAYRDALEATYHSIKSMVAEQ